MNEAVSGLLGWSEAIWWHWFAVFLRVGALTSLLPAFGEQTVPLRVKLGVAVALSIITASAVPEMQNLFVGLAGSVHVIAVEVSIGLVLGIGLRFFVIVLQTAGAIAAQATSLSQLFGGAGVEPLPAIGHVLLIAGLALAVTAGLHVRAAQFLVMSYDIFPPDVFPGPALIGQWGLAQVSHSFALAFQLAAPFVIASVLYNLTLGVINRAMPQLMVAFVGAPVITAGGLILLMLASPLMLTVWLNALNGFIENPVTGGR